MKKRSVRLTTTKIIAAGYFGVILAGALLLTLPIASKAGTWTPFVDALFTATSATCVTGLIVYDTFTHWTLLGQLILLVLIQIGGLGFMTMALSISTFTRHKIGLKERYIMQESIAAPQMGGIIRIVRFTVTATLIFEGTGALLLATRFIPQFGFGKGLYYSIFHSISAFCNAGFDLMGTIEPLSSLTSYSGDVVVNVTIMLLIVIGGFGFIAWEDIWHNRFRFKKNRLQTKIVLVTTLLLIFSGALLLFLLEYNGEAYAGKSLLDKILSSFFQSVSPRTAGFNTVNLSILKESSIVLIILLMLIGGSPGSTAGGIKTTTIAVLALCAHSVLRRRNSVQVFKRRLADEVVKNAVTIFFIYLFLFLGSSLFISAYEGISFLTAAFEAGSAIATVGLTLGITSQLSTVSHLLLIFLMYFGRVGCLTLLYAFMDPNITTPGQMPLEKVAVG